MKKINCILHMLVLSQHGHLLVYFEWSKKGQIKYIFNEGRLITSKKIKRSQAKEWD